MSRFCTFCIGLVLIAMVVGSAMAEEKTSASKTDTLSLQSNYWALYPHRADISLRTFRQLKDAPGLLELPTDHTRPSVMSNRGAIHTFSIDVTLAEKLKKLTGAKK